MAKIMSISRLRMGTDGSGISTLVAFHGCPLRCVYCINAQCNDRNTITADFSADELIENVSIDEPYFLMTGGGITFGGGEPLLYANFIHEVCNKMNSSWKCNIETSLNVGWEEIEKIINDIDYWYVDVKDVNAEIYRRYTGRDNALVLDNLYKLIDRIGKKKVCIRIPLIPQYNTEDDRDRSVGYFIRKYGSDIKLDLFKYHTKKTFPKTVTGSKDKIFMEYKIDGKYIEIYFDGMPDEKIRETLKICGWRWFGKKKCWSNAYTMDNLVWVKALATEVNPKAESPLLKLKKEIIGMTDLVVRSNSFFCNMHHELEDMAGEIEVVDRNDNVHRYLIPIVYCCSCNVYYVLEETYLELKKNGRIRAEILSYKDYQNRGNASWGELSSISPLREWGYSVSQEDGFSDRQRQSILEDIIDYGVMSKDKVLSYLDFFMKLNQHKGSRALEKWKADRTYIAQYRIGSAKKVKIGKVIVFELN